MAEREGVMRDRENLIFCYGLIGILFGVLTEETFFYGSAIGALVSFIILFYDRIKLTKEADHD